MSKDCNKNCKGNCKRCREHLLSIVNELFNIKDDLGFSPDVIYKIKNLVERKSVQINGAYTQLYEEISDDEYKLLIEYVNEVINEHPEFKYILENLEKSI